MIGLPGDSQALDMESTRQAITLAPDMVEFIPPWLLLILLWSFYFSGANIGR